MIHETADFPPEGSAQELAAFADVQRRLAPMFRTVAEDPRAPHTAVVVPSLSFDQQELEKVSGVHHYEERLLYMLMLLRRPRTRLIFLTSQPLVPEVVDYYLHLLSGVPGGHARRRLTLLTCYDASKQPLTRKILDRPRVMKRILEAIPSGQTAHLTVFNSTPLERTLAVRLGLPLYACDPALYDLGTKSGCRETFREAGVLMPEGYERLRDADDIVEALHALKSRKPGLRRAVVKLNDGFSGEGNAIFRFDGWDGVGDIRPWIRDRLPLLAFTAENDTWDRYSTKYQEMGGIVEEFIEGERKHSPSAQARVNAAGEPQVISTHDQVLGGKTGQVFLGCTFPALTDYRLEIQDAGLEVARVLARKGVIGRFGIDFVSVPRPEGEGWQHYAIEVNLRKGGTTHPFLTLRFLTDGSYDQATGDFLAPSGTPKYYYASDTLQSPRYQGLLPGDLTDISVFHDIHFHEATQRGVVFHLMGALSEFGKLGLVCIGDNPQQAYFLYRRTVGILDHETGNTPVDSVR